jgi:methylenetetrahydrofolate reductase (NADPH)
MSPTSGAHPLIDDYSLEITTRDLPDLMDAAGLIPAGAKISIAFLPGEAMTARVEAAAAVRSLGFCPIPHLSARRLPSETELHRFLDDLARRASIEEVFVVGGDPDKPEGPYPDALELIRRAELADYGVRRVGVGGYPEGHPQIDQERLQKALFDKLQELRRQGLSASITTQFGFDADPVLNWLRSLRQSGVEAPVRLGVPGPATAKTLLRFASRCGVEASARVMRKYGLNLAKLVGATGPNVLVDDLRARLDPRRHGETYLHFYPFGGVHRAASWIAAYERERTTAHA